MSDRHPYTWRYDGYRPGWGSYRLTAHGWALIRQRRLAREAARWWAVSYDI